ncbi:hypothetical protein AX15_005294 [Amanita polypyramis BW_CC]|nr:hypothetical protein AX15_005294 [Amanita polypyramis BW_CC]
MLPPHHLRTVMPGKHVHFASDIDVFSLAPSTPDSSCSVPTISDSDGPFTPPSLNYQNSPYSRSPLPSVSATLNPRLSTPTTKYGNSPITSFDLTLDPANSPIAHLPAAVLLEPATYPPSPCVVILHKRLPWSIKLIPSNPSLGYVTLQDVLYGIVAFLKQPASKAEYGLIPTEQARSNVSSAYLRRCKAAYNSEAEQLAGLKRIDFLEGRTKFYGLTGTSKGPEVWELHTTM